MAKAKEPVITVSTIFAGGQTDRQACGSVGQGKTGRSCQPPYRRRHGTKKGAITPVMAPFLSSGRKPHSRRAAR